MNSSSENLILTIDLGTGGPKVSVYNEKAVLIDSAFLPNSMHLFDDGGAEQSPKEWTDTIVAAYQEIRARNKFDSKKIKAVNVTSQWSGTVAVDDKGNALANAIIWMDSRGAEYIEKIVDGWPKIDGYAIHKILEWIRLTGGGPTRSGKDSLAHILYLKHRHPELYAKTFKFIEPKDFLNAWLCGKIVSTYETITLNWVTDNRNVNKIDYSPKLLRWTGIDRNKLPDLLPPNSNLGILSPTIKELFGLSEDCVLISGAPDTHTAAVGSGAVEDGEIHLYIGTSSWLQAHIPFKKTDIDHNMGALPSSIKGKYLLVNEQECAGVNLQFLRNNLFFPKDELNEKDPPSDFYFKMDKMASSIAPGSEGLLFLPWLYGERSPIDDHFVRGGLYNLSLNHTRAHVARAVLEGVAFNSRWLLKYVEKITGKRSPHIRFIGGGANSSVWCQIIADIMDRPIMQMKDPIHANSKGAALLASVAMGWISESEIPSLCEAQKIYEPSKESTKRYNDLFETFVTIYKKNKKIFHKLNKVNH